MSREIKFRAWDNGEMFPMAMVGEPANPSVLTASHWRECTDSVVIMQFTGLKDKNGKEIYESDILKHNDNVFIVKWTNEVCAVYGFYLEDIKFGNGNRNWRDFSWLNRLKKHIIIIGNIYENLELIPEKNKQ